jgi:hypothetical protein
MLALHDGSQGIGEQAEVLSAAFKCNVSAPHHDRCLVMLCDSQAIQKRRPRSHTIVEAHPDVHERMLEQGWDKLPGVRILFGRWQDVLPDAGLKFDGIFWDTFSEFYEDMQ